MYLYELTITNYGTVYVVSDSFCNAEKKFKEKYKNRPYENIANTGIKFNVENIKQLTTGISSSTILI